MAFIRLKDKQDLKKNTSYPLYPCLHALNRSAGFRRTRRINAYHILPAFHNRRCARSIDKPFYFGWNYLGNIPRGYPFDIFTSFRICNARYHRSFDLDKEKKGKAAFPAFYVRSLRRYFSKYICYKRDYDDICRRL